MTVPAAAITRLSTGAPTGYNNGDYDLSTNPYGFGAGGHAVNLFAFSQDVVTVGNWLASLTASIDDIDDEVAAVAALSAQLIAVANSLSAITTVAGVASAVSTVAGMASSIAGVAANVTAAANSASAAAASASAAAGSQTAAAGSATSAATSAGTATTKAADANTSAIAAAGSATAAAASQADAATSAAAAASSASSISGAVTTSAASATAAAGSAANALTSETNAAASAAAVASMPTDADLIPIRNSTGTGWLGKTYAQFADLIRQAIGTTRAAWNDTLQARGGDIATGPTLDLATATGAYIVAPGNSTITGLGNLATDGAERTVLFTGTPFLTPGANLVLSSGSNRRVKVPPNTAITFRSTGSGSWVEVGSGCAALLAAIDQGGKLTTGGTASAYTLAPDSPLLALGTAADGTRLTFRAHAACNAIPTLNVSGLGARSLRKINPSGTDVGLDANDIRANHLYEVQFSSTANFSAGGWVLIGGYANVENNANFQDATVAGDIYMTGLGYLHGNVSASWISLPGSTAGDPAGSERILDYYEYGIFTPTVAGSSTSGSATYTNRNGSYVRIGKLVHVTIQLDWSAGTGTGNLRITGLPYNPELPSALAVFSDNLTMSPATNIPEALAIGLTNRIEMRMLNSGADQNIPYDALATLRISGTYKVA